MPKRLALIFAMLLTASVIVACGRERVQTPTAVPSRAITPTVTLTALPPSPTAVPIAAVVNGTPIPLSEFQAEEARARAAAATLGTEIAPNPSQIAKTVLADMVDTALLAQAAYANGYKPPNGEEMWKQAVSEAGGEQALQAFLRKNGYTRQAFLRSLRKQRAAAWMAQRIAAQVPRSAEQVRLRQILVYNQKDAEAVLARLKHGEDFAKLAWQYDPYTGGDLGWAPRGYLLQPAVEKAAFSLKVGEVSGIIKTPLGYHIIKVEDRAVRPLDPLALQVLQHKALEDWLRRQRANASIRIFVTPMP